MKATVLALIIAVSYSCNAQSINYDSIKLQLNALKVIEACTDKNFEHVDEDGSNAVVSIIKAKLKAIKIKDEFKSSEWSFNIYPKVNCKGKVALKFSVVDNDPAELSFVYDALVSLSNITYSKSTVDFRPTFIMVTYRGGKLWF